MNLSLPPWLRYKADNMLISMLIPSNLSAAQQRKYFEKVVQDDLNPILTEGIECPCHGDPISVKVFGETLDLKGREKFQDQVSCQAYFGCSHCGICFPKGVASRSGPRYGVARTHLPTDHPLRRQQHLPYEFPAAENGGKIIIIK